MLPYVAVLVGGPAAEATVTTFNDGVLIYKVGDPGEVSIGDGLSMHVSRRAQPTSALVLTAAACSRPKSGAMASSP